MRNIILTLIRFYQAAISPMLAPRCRFYPSCSQYAAEAVGQHGALRGSWLGVCRLLKCHPFHAGGYDPVPATIPAHRCESVHPFEHHEHTGQTPGGLSTPLEHRHG